jgi:Exonuclease.
MAKLFEFDFETTGTNPEIHVPHQLGAILEIDGREVERINMRLRIPADKLPFAEPKALETARTTIEQIQAVGRDPFRAAYDLCNTLRKYVKDAEDEKFHLVEWSQDDFDSKFLRKWIGDSAMHQYFYSNPINVFSLAGHDLQNIRASLPNFKLATVVTHYGIGPKGDWHDAMTDVEVTREIYRLLNGGVRL